MVDADKVPLRLSLGIQPQNMDEPVAEQGAAFAAYYKSVFAPMVQFAVYAGAPIDLAETVVQEVGLDLLRKWDRVEKPDQWMRKAIVHRLIKIKKREREWLDRTVRGGHLTSVAGDDRDLTVWEDQQWVDQLLSTLSVAQRDVMSLIVEGFEAAEVAELLGKTPAAVRKHLQLARDRLAASLGQLRPRRTRTRTRSTGGETEWPTST